ncbi:(2Fe-2S)-binding protein [Mycobacterium sp. SMC-4]|uniref:(2Fe-2S)-binding protein n=1 Tax=Mycobacterium sp. SMC-4 TaxID=2857059 RepID=UPI0021B44568|nr:(2Fe-2S)-binding protein [Mycobacterium sp. SMC-4]UXA18039.1 (2Fe-2S)-binding protein [Mycobacterium sp. SMC-4]
MSRIHQRVDRRRVVDAVTAAAELGPYVTLHAGSGPVVSLEQMCEPEPLGELLDAVADQIGTDEPRVAASTVQFGFAARCWSLVLGVWHQARLVLDVRDVSFVVTGPGSIQLSLPELHAWDGESALLGDVAELFTAMVANHPLSRMHAGLRQTVRIAEGLLWGNAAAALASTPRAISPNRTDAQLEALTAAMLSRAPLSGRLVTTPEGVLRRSCCLWYRTRDRDHCGDCPLTDRVSRHRR